MSNSTRIESRHPGSAVSIEQTRPRQTERPASPFRDVLAGGVGVLMAGAEVVTTVVGGPVLAAAVREARAGVTSGLPPAASGGTGPSAGLPAGEGSEMASMHAMQRESQAFNLQLLGLQEEIQQENRRFTTISNVLRARHDTAKAAVSNIRS